MANSSRRNDLCGRVHPTPIVLGRGQTTTDKRERCPGRARGGAARLSPPRRAPARTGIKGGKINRQTDRRTTIMTLARCMITCTCTPLASHAYRLTCPRCLRCFRHSMHAVACMRCAHDIAWSNGLFQNGCVKLTTHIVHMHSYIQADSRQASTQACRQACMIVYI
jgi:ribosomal protein S27E